MEALRSCDIRAVIDGSFAFRGLAPAERDALETAATAVRYADGEVLLREDEEGLELLLVVAGRVRVSMLAADGDVDLADLGPGAIVGEVSVLMENRRTSTVTAAGVVDAISFVADAVREIANANPAFKDVLLKLVEGRALHTISVIPPER
jgi:CRP-like cAMP-binding protein